MILMRLFLFAIVLGVLYYIIKSAFQPSDSIRCSRCDGKGYWYDARGKERCNWCKGSGRLPKTPEK